MAYRFASRDARPPGSETTTARTRAAGGDGTCRGQTPSRLDPHTGTRFELLRRKTRSARTTPIAFRPMTSVQDRRTHPDWAPSKDESRTTREPATPNRQSTDRDGKRCGVREE